MTHSAPTKKELLSYGILAMPLAFAGIPLYIHAPDFYATEYGISLANLGIALLCLRIFDAVQDPLIGYLSDKYAQHRPAILALGCVLLVASFALLFKPLTSSYVIWFTVCVLLCTSAFSLLTINLNTLGGLWSRDKNHKTTIAGFREALGLVGLILAVTLPSILQNQMPKEQAFLYVSLLLAGIMGVAIVVFGRWQKQHLSLNTTNKQHTFNIQQITALPKQTKHFFAVYGVAMLASSIPAVLVLFFIRDRLNLESDTGLFLLIYFLAGAIGIPLWQKLSQIMGKHSTWLAAMILAVVSFVWAYFLAAGDFWPYLAICVLSGIAFGAQLVLPASILADHIQHTDKQDNAALHFGLLAFLAKLALALAAFITLPYLESAGFNAGQTNDETALHALSLAYGVIPCFVQLISIYLLWRVIHDKKPHNSNRSAHHA